MGRISEYEVRQRTPPHGRQKWEMDQSHLDYNPSEPMGVRETRAVGDLGK
jgi:hypothetical protein